MLLAILTCSLGNYGSSVALDLLLDDFGANSNYALLAGDAAGIRVAVSGGSRGPGASMSRRAASGRAQLLAKRGSIRPCKLRRNWYQIRTRPGCFRDARGTSKIGANPANSS